MTRANGQRPLRVGIAGLGYGVDVHLPGFRGLGDVEVIGLLGRDAVRASAVAARTGLPVSTDLATWLAARGRPNAVDFEFAELASFAALHDAIHAGAIGRVRHATVLWLMESRAHRGGGWSWKTDAARGGGALTLLGTHVFYMLEWLLAPIARLTARLDCRESARLLPSPEAQPADDLAHLTLEHRDGAITSVVLGNANPGIATQRWTIVGDGGTAILDNMTRNLAGGFRYGLEIFAPDGRIVRQAADAETQGDSRIAPFARLAARFVEAVRTGGQCRPSFADALRVAQLGDATRRAAQTGTWVEIAGEPA
jgi:predicted dehydrogenase